MFRSSFNGSELKFRVFQRLEFGYTGKGVLPGFPGITGVEEQRRSLETDPVPFPASSSGQFYLVPLPKHPFLHAQETGIRRRKIEIGN